MLKAFANDIDICKALVDIVNVTCVWPRIEFLLEFLKINKSVNDFKLLPLFPPLESWTGSKVPLILKKLKFLNDLKSQIKGLEYLKHIQYINEQCDWLKKYQEEVEMREYMESSQ